MTYLDKLKKIDARRGESRHATRICAELTYLDRLSDYYGGRYDGQIERAADALLAEIAQDGVITAGAVRRTEELLAELAPVAKSLKEIFVAHAHIDMNWQWGYQETAVITVDTFRTVLELMREYPELTFAQSQASTYEIIEKYRPDMLDEIRARIAEGRWEVTAAEWVEPDKNMPSGESMTRQILEAKKYLSALLRIPAESLEIDFVPDTFGHAATVPEILCNAGIRYLYHCRGSEGPCFYRYRAPSGKEVLAYREYSWYNRNIDTNCFEIVPKFCAQEKLDTYLCVYGVGDHGGGPTRLDIERILEYRSWPLTPDIRFGTYRDFFETAERSGVDFPVLDTERNFLFSGCYTTQSRIKMANRMAEARIGEAEALASVAAVRAALPTPRGRFEQPWRNILFSHFHDILPGSGTVETREYAMGKFQETLATVQTAASLSMNAIADAIDTSAIDFSDELLLRAEGGGVGYEVNEKGRFRFPSAERGRGSVRVLHVFNPTAYDRDEVTELTLWDYNYDPAQTVMTYADGEEIPFALKSNVKQDPAYWGHTYRKYWARLRVPAFGYTTVVARQRPYEGRMDPRVSTYEHTDHEFVNSEPIVLENEKLRAVFDKSTGHLLMLLDKRTSETLIDRPSCCFRFIEENPIYGMAAWRIGPYMKVLDLNAHCGVRVTEIQQSAVYSSFRYRLEYLRSSIEVKVGLRQNSEMLDWDVRVDWKEDAEPGRMIPQLAFTVPVSYRTDGTSLSEIPYGVLTREAGAYDIPSLGALAVGGESRHKVAILADTKYGFRCCEDYGQVTLLRNACSPDPYSDRGIHHIRLGVAACETSRIGALSAELCHPMPYVSGRCHAGTLPMTESFMRLCGADLRVSAVKPAEDGEGQVVRLYHIGDSATEATLTFACPLSRAYLTDTNESILRELTPTGNVLRLPIEAHAVVTLRVIF